MKAPLAALVLFASLLPLCSFAQKKMSRHETDSLARLDSVRTYMLKASLLAMNAMQAKIESQKPDGKGGITVNPQKTGEAQNLFVQSRFFYRKAIDFDPTYYSAWSNLGTTYFFEGLPKAAVPYFRKSIELNPNYAQGWYNLGKAYDQAGRKDSALIALKECIRSDSGYVQGYIELSRIYMTDKDSASALKVLRMAIRHKPGSELSWTTMALVYLQANDTTASIGAMEKAAALNPENVDRLFNLALYFQEHGNLEKADYYRQQANEVILRQEIPHDEGESED